MPPWPAQQWRAILPRHSYFTLPRRSFYIPIKKPSRPFATVASKPALQQTPPESSSTSGAEKRPVPPRRSVIISHSIRNTTPEDIIAHIEPYSTPVDQSFKEPLAVFFLTPSFAKWLLDDETFLRKALQRVYEHTINDPEIDQTIHTLVAVVDRLPAPSITGDSKNGVDGAAFMARPPHVAEDGYEGVAYALAGTNCLPSYATSQVMTDPLDRSPSTISLHNFLKFEDERATESLYANTIQIPLANTIFHTGYSATMFSSWWRKPKGATAIRLEKKTQLKHQSIHWPDTGRGQNIVALSIPLIPLTTPRCIEAGMGNIIRRLLGPNQKSMTASQELEESVPQYFSVRGISPRAMTVWALVIPQDILLVVANKMTDLLAEEVLGLENAETVSSDLTSLFRALWKRNPPAWNNVVWSAMKEGARLHRVLSGGGGWGKKAGLLSLDPDQSYNELREISGNSALESMDSSEGLSALHEVAKPGEFIQFFMSPSDADTSRPEGIKDLPASNRLWSLEFGTISSSIDSMPESSSQKAGDTFSPRITVFRKHFGALSEGGMSITRQYQAKRMGSWDTVVRSKIDVPYSRFSAVQFKGVKDVENISSAKASELAEKSDDPQKIPIRKVASVDYRKKFQQTKTSATSQSAGTRAASLLLSKKSKNTRNMEAPAVISRDGQQENNGINYNIPEGANVTNSYGSPVRLYHAADTISSLPHEPESFPPKSPTVRTAGIDEIGLNEAIPPSGRRDRSELIHHHISLKGQARMPADPSSDVSASSVVRKVYAKDHPKVTNPSLDWRTLLKLKNIGEEFVSLRKEVAKVAMRRRQQNRSQRSHRQQNTTANLNSKSNSSSNEVSYGSSSSIPDLEPQLGSSTLLPIRKYISNNIDMTKILLDTTYICYQVNCLHLDLRRTIDTILKRLLNKSPRVSMRGRDVLAIIHEQILTKNSERPPMQEIVNVPVSEADTKEVRDFLILLANVKLALRGVRPLPPAQMEKIVTADIHRRMQKRSLVRFMGKFSVEKPRQRPRQRPRQNLVRFVKQGVVRKIEANEYSPPQLSVRKTLHLPRQTRQREKTSSTRQSTVRVRRPRGKTLDPEAQKLADEVEQWLKGF